MVTVSGPPLGIHCHWCQYEYRNVHSDLVTINKSGQWLVTESQLSSQHHQTSEDRKGTWRLNIIETPFWSKKNPKGSLLSYYELISLCVFLKWLHLPNVSFCMLFLTCYVYVWITVTQLDGLSGNITSGDTVLSVFTDKKPKIWMWI